MSKEREGEVGEVRECKTVSFLSFTCSVILFVLIVDKGFRKRLKEEP